MKCKIVFPVWLKDLRKEGCLVGINHYGCEELIVKSSDFFEYNESTDTLSVLKDGVINLIDLSVFTSLRYLSEEESVLLEIRMSCDEKCHKQKVILSCVILVPFFALIQSLYDHKLHLLQKFNAIWYGVTPPTFLLPLPLVFCLIMALLWIFGFTILEMISEAQATRMIHKIQNG